MKTSQVVVNTDCLEFLASRRNYRFDMTWCDPPFLAGKKYENFDDNMPHQDYWNFIQRVLNMTYEHTAEGGAIYVMQREKNLGKLMLGLGAAGWNIRNIIIWKKMTSAVPQKSKFGLAYQPIVYAIKGDKPKTFNKLRIDPPLEPHQKKARKNGVFVSDVWTDIRELTAGYFAGDEALRYNTSYPTVNGAWTAKHPDIGILQPEKPRVHAQQTPLALVLRMMLTSTMTGDIVFDPFVGTGTSLIVGDQTNRNVFGTENSVDYYSMASYRLAVKRRADYLDKHYDYYRYTPNLNKIWGDLLSWEEERLASLNRKAHGDISTCESIKLTHLST